jgi:hypothetical protein
MATRASAGRSGVTAVRVGLVVAAAAYAWLLAGTTPFTVGADATTAVALVAIVVTAIAQRLSPPEAPPRPWDRLPADRPPGVGSAHSWAALVAVVVAWELFSYLAGPRSAHPTLSSIEGAVARWHATKAVVVLGWLALGAYLVRR